MVRMGRLVSTNHSSSSEWRDSVNVLSHSGLVEADWGTDDRAASKPVDRLTALVYLDHRSMSRSATPESEQLDIDDEAAISACPASS
jgi:hypothetical protein